MNNNDNKQTICSRCGSPSVASAKFTRQVGNSLFPITVTKFRCTNNECQKDSDNKQAEILTARLEREEKSRNNHSKIAKKSALMSLAK